MLPNEPDENDTLELLALPPLPPPRSCDVDYRELWEMGRRLSCALDALLGAITGLLIDTDEPTADNETLEAEVARAALRLENEIPPFGPTEDPFWGWLWIAPPLADKFVDAVSSVQSKVAYLVTELGLSRAQGEAFWSKAYKQFSVARELLDNGIAKLECEPDLNRQLHHEARRKLEAKAEPTAKGDAPRLGDVATFAEPPAKPAAVEAPASEVATQRAASAEPAQAETATAMPSIQEPIDVTCPNPGPVIPPQRAREWCHENGIAVPRELEPTYLVVRHERTGTPYRLETDTGPQWLGKPYQRGSSWVAQDTLYRRKRWLLVTHHYATADLLLGDDAIAPIFRIITSTDAYKWLERNGHSVSNDVPQDAPTEQEALTEAITVGRERHADATGKVAAEAAGLLPINDDDDRSSAVDGWNDADVDGPFDITGKIRSYRERALEHYSGQRRAERIPVVDAAGNVDGSFDLGDPGAKLLIDHLDVENLEAAFCNGNEPAPDNLLYRLWQLFRRGPGDYVKVSLYGDEDCFPAGRLLSARDAATLCYQSGRCLPDVVLDDLEAESRDDGRQSAEPPTMPAVEAPIVEAPASGAATVEAAAVEPAPSSKAAVEALNYNELATTILAELEAELRANPWAMSDRKLAQHIRERGYGCSSSTASDIPVWKAFKKRRGPPPKSGRGKAPRVVSFTSKMEATVGRPDEALEALMNEADFEPSPLDDDPPGEPRRVRIEHREP